eukprot:Amastigsp_a508342_82.p2 type:complete len:338 gc:universal Amastigsp_a508342_82:1303-290(-)
MQKVDKVEDVARGVLETLEDLAKRRRQLAAVLGEELLDFASVESFVVVLVDALIRLSQPPHALNDKARVRGPRHNVRVRRAAHERVDKVQKFDKIEGSVAIRVHFRKDALDAADDVDDVNRVADASEQLGLVDRRVVVRVVRGKVRLEDAVHSVEHAPELGRLHAGCRERVRHRQSRARLLQTRLAQIEIAKRAVVRLGARGEPARKALPAALRVRARLELQRMLMQRNKGCVRSSAAAGARFGARCGAVRARGIRRHVHEQKEPRHGEHVRVGRVRDRGPQLVELDREPGEVHRAELDHVRLGNGATAVAVMGLEELAQERENRLHTCGVVVREQI